MTKFENTTLLTQPASEVYAFLADLRNHQQLMPDNIQEWNATENEATFTIKNMAKLSIQIDEKIPNVSICAVPKDKAPFALKMLWTLSQENTGTKASFCIEADLNMMMKMIASGPLQKLTDFQVQKLAEVLANKLS